MAEGFRGKSHAYSTCSLGLHLAFPERKSPETQRRHSGQNGEMEEDTVNAIKHTHTHTRSKWAVRNSEYEILCKPPSLI